MTIVKMKEEMKSYNDFYGGDLLGVGDIAKAKTKSDLAKIINDHETHMEMMLCDALSHLSSFRKKLDL